MRNLAIIVPLKSKLSGKFQRFSTIDESIEKLKNSWISKNSKLNEKLYNILQDPNRESPKKIFQPPSSSLIPPDKILLHL